MRQEALVFVSVGGSIWRQIVCTFFLQSFELGNIGD